MRCEFTQINCTFTCVTAADDCVMGPGFRVFIGEHQMPFAVSFEAEMVTDENTTTGSTQWELRLEELIPAGNAEADAPESDFELRLESDTVTETYYHCSWTSHRREFTRQGLRRIRTGISTLREEANGE